MLFSRSVSGGNRAASERNLKRAQQSQNACYDTKCYGQRFHAGDRVWYRNRTRTPSPSSRELGGQVQRTLVDSGEVDMVAGNGGQMQTAPINSGEVELEWFEIPASPVTECQPDVLEDSGMLIPASPVADVPGSPVTEIPHQPEVPMEGGPPVAENKSDRGVKGESRLGSETMLEQLCASQSSSWTSLELLHVKSY
ncbi:hypothetical protein OS493_021619 [Desmophyllum pertusum]|uniref:Uncharacterized protein n=1 Tax=Desmophyllum pertusum TaxID=174260 RepID=A0A9W9YE74_9CNID|nr:hypothetical protein OS493_021619 [Desmophyllum pertusum]